MIWKACLMSIDKVRLWIANLNIYASFLCYHSVCRCVLVTMNVSTNDLSCLCQLTRLCFVMSIADVILLSWFVNWQRWRLLCQLTITELNLPWSIKMHTFEHSGSMWVGVWVIVSTKHLMFLCQFTTLRFVMSIDKVMFLSWSVNWQRWCFSHVKWQRMSYICIAQ